jgi:hypothetical protein
MLRSGIDHDAGQLHVPEDHDRLGAQKLALDKQRRLIRRNARGRNHGLIAALGRRDWNRRNHHHERDDGAGLSCGAHHSRLLKHPVHLKRVAHRGRHKEGAGIAQVP